MLLDTSFSIGRYIVISCLFVARDLPASSILLLAGRGWKGRGGDGKGVRAVHAIPKKRVHMMDINASGREPGAYDRETGKGRRSD